MADVPQSPDMNRETPLLETARLLLRPPRIEDFDEFAAYMSDADSARFLGGAQPRTVAWRSFLQLAGAWELQGFAMFSVLAKDSGSWIGRVGPWMPEGWPGTEVGWGIIGRCCNQGFATEAATAAIDWAFDALGWSEVIHAIAPDNHASQAVAKKLGSTNRGRGQLPPPYDGSPIDLWGQSRQEWRARRSDNRP